jgi:hypothetical protein
MTHQESQELKTYLEQRFDGVDKRLDRVDQRLDGIDGRLAGIDTHLGRQDIDFNKTTKNLLLTIQDATKESRKYAARLFGILDRPLLDTEDVPKPARPRQPKRPRTRPGR